MAKQQQDGITVVASNRAARHEFRIEDTFECGMVLRGSEVKSLRESKVQIAESFAQLDGGEMWLLNLHIAPYSHSQRHSGHEPMRRRKLLLHMLLHEVRHFAQIAYAARIAGHVPPGEHDLFYFQDFA